ncbi:GTP pyrophosphokinase [Konateibacter massiliensis]|uniref:GTP pyrophosphokinase n=1 Tax=Konateibacter massiliensis TaxID=2002841 RepID=UPI000C144E68|nr:GTP pyrophosphokinase family protein [Konateibacter massiliensis]
MADLEENESILGGELRVIEQNQLLRNSEILINQTLKFQELMMMYSCAIKEVKTKLEVLNAELSVRYKRNPIEFISSRIKKPASIAKKLQKKGKDINVHEIESTLSDVAGVRVICSFVDDIYEIASMLVRQDDITLVDQKDYIHEPKENGYRSLHLIIEIPVFFSDQKKMMRVEVQIRTIAMDFWASLEHQLRYKSVVNNEEEINRELKECADVIAATDVKMLNIRNKIQENTDDEETILDKMDKMDFSSFY